MNKVKKFNKLVRDKIPDIIKSEGKNPATRVLSQTEYYAALKAKLKEETDEFLKSDTLEELADILEVAFAIAAHLNVSREELEEMRIGKQLERGGFSERIFLLETKRIVKK